MRKLVLILLVLPLMGSTATATNVWYSSGAAGVAVTAVNTNTAFTWNAGGGDGTAYNALWVLVRSRSTSANTCFLRLGGTPASATADLRLEPGASVSFVFSPSSGGTGWARYSAICAAAETATWDVDAGR